ncbi:MAG: hypothetical protein AAB538_03775 [Patescibacteria group bacterium]
MKQDNFDEEVAKIRRKRVDGKPDSDTAISIAALHLAVYQIWQKAQKSAEPGEIVDTRLYLAQVEAIEGLARELEVLDDYKRRFLSAVNRDVNRDTGGQPEVVHRPALDGRSRRK